MTFVQKVPNERIEVTYRDQGDRAYALMSLIRAPVHPDVKNFSAFYRIQPVLFFACLRSIWLCFMAKELRKAQNYTRKPEQSDHSRFNKQIG